MFISWKDFIRHSYQKQKPRTIMKLDHIEEPPCKHCKFFDPKSVKLAFDGDSSTGSQDRDREASGFRLCWKDKMHGDFSCYTPKEDNNGSND